MTVDKIVLVNPDGIDVAVTRPEPAVEEPPMPNPLPPADPYVLVYAVE